MISEGGEVCYVHTNTWFHFCLKIAMKYTIFLKSSIFKEEKNYAYNAKLVSLILMSTKITENTKYKTPRRM